MPAPAKISVDELPVDEKTAAFHQVRLVERSNTGAHLVMGLQWHQPGGEPVSWDAADDTHEAFYVVQGSIAVRWRGPDSGEERLEAGDAFFLAPGRHYSVTAPGLHPAFLVWALTPAPAVAAGT